MEKNRLFQYAWEDGIYTSGLSMSNIKIVENTELITEKEANDLWDKYYHEVVKRIEKNQRPQMCIWKDCDSNTSYHTIEKEIDWRDDLEVKNGKIYKKTLEEIS